MVHRPRAGEDSCGSDDSGYKNRPLRRGRKIVDFDATLGYPGEGPSVDDSDSGGGAELTEAELGLFSLGLAILQFAEEEARWAAFKLFSGPPKFAKRSANLAAEDSAAGLQRRGR